MGKIKSFMSKHKKKLTISLMTTALTVFSALSCAAEEVGAGSSTIQESFSTGVQTISEDILSYIGIVIPIALGVIGASFAIKKGISFVKALLGKA